MIIRTDVYMMCCPDTLAYWQFRLLVDGKPVSEASLSPDGYVGSVGTDKNFRGRGYCKQLLQELVSFADTKGIARLRLDVAIDNTSAIRAYLSVGFQKIHSSKTTIRMERRK